MPKECYNQKAVQRFFGGWVLRALCYYIWQVNVEGAETSKDWPEFGKAEYWECELQAGEMLYIPLKWSVSYCSFCFA